MRYPASEKLEIIRLVEGSHQSVKRTLEQIGVSRPTFYRWYDLYRRFGESGLQDRHGGPGRVWNRIPEEVREQVIEMALDDAELSPRELATKFTDEHRYFVSEASVYRFLKGEPLMRHWFKHNGERPDPQPRLHRHVSRPLSADCFAIACRATEEFTDKTTAPNQLWQTDFTYLKVIGWGWFYLLTVLDDFSRYIIAWKLCTGMAACDDETLFAIGSRTMVE